MPSINDWQWKGTLGNVLRVLISVCTTTQTEKKLFFFIQTFAGFVYSACVKTECLRSNFVNMQADLSFLTVHQRRTASQFASQIITKFNIIHFYSCGSLYIIYNLLTLQDIFSCQNSVCLSYGKRQSRCKALEIMENSVLYIGLLRLVF